MHRCFAVGYLVKVADVQLSVSGRPRCACATLEERFFMWNGAHKYRGIHVIDSKASMYDSTYWSRWSLKRSSVGGESEEGEGRNLRLSQSGGTSDQEHGLERSSRNTFVRRDYFLDHEALLMWNVQNAQAVCIARGS